MKTEEYNNYLHNIIRDKYNGCGFGSEKIYNKIYKTIYNKYNVSNIMMIPNVTNKIFESRKLNHTLNTSKIEELAFILIKEKYPNVRRQYKDDERYPWHCDFYIPELDYFIEINGNWTHGKHPYDSNSIKDQEILNKWNKMYNNGQHPFYLSAIKTWTICDVNKRNTAINNNLNYIEIWNIDDLYKFINKI